MARVTKREVYETESKIEVLSQEKISAQEKTSNEQQSSEIQGIVVNKNDAKAAVDFAHAKKSDGQLQATLLKGQLLDTASRLDQFREGDLKGLEKEAKKFGIEDLGVIKDNLGKDIVKKEGPGIEDMYKKGKKYEMPDRDPLKDTPKTLKQEKDAKKGPDTPFKDDPGLVSVDQATKDGLNAIFGGKVGEGKAASVDKQIMEKQADLAGPKAQEAVKELDKAGVFDAMKLAKENSKKYSDPDQIDATKVEKPKDPPPNSKDLLGHKVNPLHHDPIIDTENIDIKKVVAEHQGPKKTQIYTDPDQMQKKAKFDPTNPPRIEENELKNTGNPNDFYATQFELPKGGGDKPHTDGEGGESGADNPLKFKTGTVSGDGSGDKVSLPFGPNPTDDDDEEDVGPNVPR